MSCRVPPGVRSEGSAGAAALGISDVDNVLLTRVLSRAVFWSGGTEGGREEAERVMRVL